MQALKEAYQALSGSIFTEDDGLMVKLRECISWFSTFLTFYPPLFFKLKNAQFHSLKTPLIFHLCTKRTL